MIHLHSITLDRGRIAKGEGYPYDVPVIKTLDTLEFSSEVTFLVGENGSGKSTILETIACAVGSITVGSESVQTDKSLAPLRKLAKEMRLAWNKRTHAGFFMRTEDFFGFSKKLLSTREEYLEDLQRMDEETKGRSEYTRALARMPYMLELHEMKRRYGEDLSARSHGESYFTLFRSRFVPNGLYLLDEPEAPLSPVRQLALISMLKEMVEKQNAQFIIATHSPIIMAYPDAAIYVFENGTMKRTRYEEVEHVAVTRQFLNDPEQFLRQL